MTVGFMRWLRRVDTIKSASDIAVTIGNDVIAPLLCREFTPFAVKSPLRRRKSGNTDQ
jgi:hypothetical protein